MTEHTQVILPPPSKEEDTVVERFVTASREIAPTVQVSLAKRILQPGSNRVVCLAAHTTVPLNEDELASVSDLALRLSDGTNVRLSVSFFNDESGTIFGDAVPFARNIYDPHRYSMQTGGDSKLGLVLCAMATIVLASYYAYKNCNFNPLAPAKLPAPIAASTVAKPSALKPATGSAKPVNKSAAKASEHSTKAHFAKEDFLPEAPMRSHGRNAKSVRHINAEEPSTPYTLGKHSSRSKPDLMLVPPPPPFAVPLGGTGMPFAPSYDLRNVEGANQFGISPKASSPVRPPKQDAPPRSSGVKASGATQPAAVRKVELDPDVLLPGAAPARSYSDFTAASATKPQKPVPADISSSAPNPAPIEQYRGGVLETAPIPGDSIQLERIIPPQQ
jgi:hypothetical protein